LILASISRAGESPPAGGDLLGDLIGDLLFDFFMCVAWCCLTRLLDTLWASGHPGAMDSLLRFSGSVRRAPEVEAWFSSSEPLRLMARTWFECMRGCGADVRELLHDGCPVACVKDAPFGYVNAFKAHASVGFFQGAMLADPAGLLEGSGKYMRHVKLRLDREPDPDALGDLITAAYHDIRRRLAAD
jgi:hypothetical protein